MVTNLNIGFASSAVSRSCTNSLIMSFPALIHTGRVAKRDGRQRKRGVNAVEEDVELRAIGRVDANHCAVTSKHAKQNAFMM